MSMTDTATAVHFVRSVFGIATHGVFVSSLPNVRGDHPGEKSALTRDTATIAAHLARWDRQGRGYFFCVGTVPEGTMAPAGESVRRKTNIAENVFLHADVDAKGIAIDLAEARRRIEALPLPPSIIVNSGNGLHVYWLLNEPVTPDDAFEATLRQLADLVGGDPSVVDRSRLMRLPGSHNTKDGAYKKVEILSADYERRYNLCDIEDMLGYMPPIIARRVSDTRANEPQNPYLAAAARFGYKPPLDVEAALAGMSYGAGDSGIHQTQLRVSASLLSKGEATANVVAILLDATRAAAGALGANWNWQREERALYRMCEEWLRKHPPEPKARTEPARESVAETPKAQSGSGESSVRDEQPSGAGVKVHDFAAEKAKRKPKAATKDDGDPPHVALGAAVIEVIQKRGEALLVTAGEVWRYADGLWSSAMLDGRRWLDVELEKGARALGMKSTAKLINEARLWIMRNPDLYRDEVTWDAHGKIPTRSGLVDPDTLAVEAPRLEHYATWRVECEYEPGAGCPAWGRMLGDTFADRDDGLRAATIETLQETVGLSLVDAKPKSLTKAVVLIGGSDSGKTTILDVVGGLQSDRPISTPLDGLGGTHGLMEFTRRAPWVLHEAFDQSKWHFSALVKSILTGDPVQINIKNGPLVTQRVRAPVFWGTNHPPQFKEATKAIVNRLVVIPCRQTFRESSPVGVAVDARRHGFADPAAYVLATEKPGLLNWAIAGLRRAKARGHLELTAEIEELRVEIRAESNLVEGFMKECVTFNKDGMVATTDFCAAFTVWWEENKGERRGTPSNDAIGKAISSLGDGRIASYRTNEARLYVGVHLNEIGLDYWRGAASGTAAQGKTARISKSSDAVNKAISGAWSTFPIVARMTAEHERHAERLRRDTSKTAAVTTDTSVTAEGASVTEVSPKASQSKPLF